MLTAVFLILAIAAVALHLFNSYTSTPPKLKAFVSELIAWLAIVLAILIGFGLVKLPAGFQ